MSDSTTITPEERARLRAIAAKPNHLSHRDGIHAALNNLLNALEHAEARAEKDEKELAGADAEISSLRDELEDSRGTEKDAPSVLCAIARLLGVYEHSQESGDDMGQMVLEEVQNLISDKQNAVAEVTLLNKMCDWLAMHVSGYDDSKKRTVYGVEWKEAARRAVADSEVKG